MMRRCVQCFALLLISFTLKAQNVPPTIGINDFSSHLSGEVLSLDAQATDGNGDPLTYYWKVESAPLGSKQNLTDITSSTPSLELDRSGNFILSLEVSDSASTTSKLIYITSVETQGQLVYGPDEVKAKVACKKLIKSSICSDTTRTFNITDPSGEFTLIAKNNGLVTALIEINGAPVASFYEFTGEGETFTKKITLQASNTLTVLVGGRETESLEISIKRNETFSDSNTPPDLTIQDITYYSDSGGEEAFTLSDPDVSDTTALEILALPRFGSAQVLGSSIRYTPKKGSTEADEFLVAVLDNGTPQKIRAKRVKALFSTGNRPPEVSASALISNGEEVILEVAIDDNTSDTHVITIESNPSNGSAQVLNNQFIKYTPNPGYVGNESFQIRVTDNGAPSLSTVHAISGNIQVNSLPLIVSSPTISTPQGVALTNKVNFTDNDSGQVVTSTIETQPLHGTLTLSSKGNFTYAPAPDYSGTDSFTLKISDNATSPLFILHEVILTIEENNIPNVFGGGTFEALSGVESRNPFSFADSNSGQNHTFSIIKSPIGGVAEISGFTLSYTASLEFTGEDELVLAVTDNGFPSKTGLATFKFIVRGNNSPTPAVSIYSPLPITPGGFASLRIFPNDPDQNQKHFYNVSRLPTGGSVSFNPTTDGLLRYTANSSFSGIDSFDVTVTDDGFPPMQAVVTVEIPVVENHAPSSNSLTLTTTEGLEQKIYIPAIDIDNGQVHSRLIQVHPINGTLRLEGGFAFYKANSNFIGNDSFQIQVTDDAPIPLSGITTVSVISEGNSVPVITTVNPSIITSGTFAGAAVINYNDPDEIRGQKIFSEIYSQPQSGTAQAYSANKGATSALYTPNSGFSGADSFVLRIYDEATPSLDAFVTINVTVESNQAPSPIASSIKMLQNHQNSAFARVSANDPNTNDYHTYGIFAPPVGGIAEIDSRGILTYIPQKDFFGSDSVGVLVTENNRSPNLSGTVAVSVQVVEDLPPVPTAQTLTTFQGKTSSTQIFHNDPNAIEFPNFQQFGYEVLTFPTNGTIIISSSGLATYTPSLGFSGIDSFEVKVFETSAPTMFGIVSIPVTVTPNTNPALSIANFDVTSGDHQSLTATLTDIDVGQTLSFALLENPTQGQVVIGPNKLVTYTANSNASGVDTFKLKAIDNALPPGETEITVTTNITVNTAPVVSANAIQVFQGQSGQAQVTYTDANPNQSHIYSIVTPPTNGTSTINSSGLLTYNPNIGSSHSSDSITVGVSDSSNPSLTGTFVVPVNITLNSAPVLSANPSSINTFQSTSASTQVSFTDPDAGQTHVYAISTQGSLGNASISQAGVLTYTPNSGVSGNDSIVVSVTDSANPAGVGTLSIPVSITANTNPTIAFSDFTTFQSTQTGSLPVTINDPDQNQTHILSLKSGAGPLHGTVSINDFNKTLTYNPTIGYSGNDSFTLEVKDNAIPNGVGEKIVNVTVLGNTAPVITGVNSISTFQTTAATENFIVTDVDSSQSLNVSVSIQPTNGTAYISYVGTGDNYVLNYQPTNGFSGTDSLTIEATDNANPAAITTKVVTLNVTPNTAPSVSPINLSFSQNASAQTVQIIFNDPDQGQGHTFALVTQPTKGVANLNNQTGDLTFTPSFGVSGSDSFLVSVTDSAIPQATGVATVSVTILDNRAPTILGANSVSIKENETLSFNYTSTDPDVGQNNFFSITQFPTHASAFIDFLTGELTLTAFEGYTGADSLQVQVVDNGTPQLTDTLTITLNILEGNKSPTAFATPNPILALSGESKTSQLTVTDPNTSDTHTFSVVSNPSNGTASVDTNGLVTYTSNALFVGVDDLVVRITDSGIPALSFDQNISVQVQANSAPTPVNQSLSLLDNTSTTTTIAANDPDSSQSHTFSINSTPALGTASVDNSGLFSFIANPLVSGTEVIEVVVTDNGSPSLSTSAFITVNVFLNAAPVITNTDFSVNENTPINVQITIDDPNADLKDYTAAITTAPINGSASVDANGLITYTPNTSYVGADSLEISVTDSGNPPLTATKILNITVLSTGGNLPPNLASISRDKLYGSTPETGRFVLDASDSDGQITKVEWDFGDGTPIKTVLLSEVGALKILETHQTFTSTGPFNITATVYDDQNASATLSQSFGMETNARPIARVTATALAGTAPLTTTLDASTSSDLHGTINSFVWTILETGEQYTTASMTHTFTQSGLYNVRLKLKDDLGVTTFETIKIAVDAPAELQAPFVHVLSSSRLSGTAPLVVNLDISNSFDIDGTLIDARLDTTDYLSYNTEFNQTGSMVFKRPGHYTLKATVIDDDEISYTRDLPVWVGPDAAPQAEFFALDNGGLNIHFVIVSLGMLDQYSFFWNFGDNTSSLEKEPEHIYSSPGTYTVELLVIDVKGRSTTISHDITISSTQDVPTLVLDNFDDRDVQVNSFVSLDASGSFDPQAGALTYFFDFGNADFQMTSSATTQFTQGAVYPVDVFVTNARGLSSTHFLTVNSIFGALPTAVALVSPLSGPAPLTINLDASTSSDSDGTIGRVLWRSGIFDQYGVEISGDQVTDVAVLDTPGTYNISLIVEDNQGNLSRDIKTVTVTGINKNKTAKTIKFNSAKRKLK